jgi:putative spermidine/putrescine transport system ATP-binding protein
LVTLLGPSGSGKSTILGIAAGIISPDYGQVLFKGRDVTDRPSHERDVGMVFQRYTLFPNMTVADNVAFPLRARSVSPAEISERVRHFLDLVGLVAQSDRYPSQISGGQAQRVALARALVFGPALLLMDEPLGALDRRLRQVLQDEIRRIHDETKVPTLYVTHDQEEAMNLSDRIVLVHDGRIAAAGAPRDLYLGPRTLWSAEFLGDINRCDVVEVSDREDDGHCAVTTSHGMRLRARIPPQLSESSATMLVVRPEDCRLSAERPEGRAAFPGTVLGAAFLGPYQRLHVRLDAGWTITAMQPGSAATYDPGAAVYCHWDDDAPLLVATA